MNIEKNDFHKSRSISETTKRQKDMLKIEDKIYELVFNSNPHPTSKLNETINYTKECWCDLFTFFDDGHIEMMINTVKEL